MSTQTLFDALTPVQICSTFLIISVVAGQLSHLKVLWSLRKITASTMAVLIGLSTGLLLVSTLNNLVIGLILIVQTYRLFSFLRVVKSCTQKDALKTRSYRSETFFASFILFFLALGIYMQNKSINLRVFLLILGLAQVICASAFLLKTKKTSSKTKLLQINKHLADIDLPSITVAIPARNETSDLTSCLQSILATNYPKMEVIVLDDCSQDATSEIIKSFAHEGVRFLEGKVPTGSWLAKNFAYQQLLDEAEGKYVIFCGVDVRFEVNSLKLLTEQIIVQNLEMTSVLPTRLGLSFRQQIVQPMRYWRELAMPRLFNKFPASLTTCWAVDRDFLNNIGGFKAYKQSVRPEKHFAKKAQAMHQYAFLRSSTGLGIASIKDYKQRMQTATRTRYPEHKKRPENIFIFSLWFLMVFIMPFFIFVISLISNYLFSGFLGLISMILLLYVHFTVDQLTNGRGDTKRLLTFPLSVISEIILINYSMWAYEFSEVIWKGRNICLPVLKTYNKLPFIRKV